MRISESPRLCSAIAGRSRAMLLIWIVAIAALLAPNLLRAETLDEVTIKRVGDIAEIEVRFAMNVQYLRHFPLDQGDTLRVYVALVTKFGATPSVVQEYRKSPPNDLLPPFMVMFPDQGGSIRIQFAKPVSFKVGPGSDTRSIRIRVALPPQKQAPDKGAAKAEKPAAGIALGTPGELVPVPPARAPPAAAKPPVATGTTTPPATTVPVPPTATAAAAATEVDAEAGTLLAKARAAIDAGDYATAIDALNRLLNLPPGRFSQEAQELVGVARQLNGEIAKARAEFELYLKLYPEGEGAARVRDRLASLGKAPAEGQREVASVKEQRGTEKSIYGSFSQYYYRGATKIDTTTKPPQLLSSEQLSFTDQSALISSLDVTGRVRRDNSDTRAVLRDTYGMDLLGDGENENRLYAGYLEHEQKNWGLMMRAGRQSPPTGGAVERFNGGYARQSMGQWLHVFGLGGTPKDFQLDSKRRFYQGGLEIGRDSGAWGLTLYGFNQTIDDIPDRRTVGGEVRYFSNGSSIYTLVDYDILFKDLNILLTQGNWQGANGTSVNLIFDRRKTPTLQTANALVGESTTSIQQLLDSGFTAETLRDRAAAVTADSTLFLVGLTQTVNSHWQFGGDVRGNRISATEGAGLLPPTPGTGTINTYSLQATATGIFSNSDVNVVSVGLIDAPTYSGPLVLLSNSTTWNNWRFEPSLRYYRQTDDTGSKLTRINPAVRLTYTLHDQVSLEAEAGYEMSNTDTVFAVDKTRRHYFSLGYRWDFN